MDAYGLELSDSIDDSNEFGKSGGPDEVDGGGESGIAGISAVEKNLDLVLGDEGEEAADVLDEVAGWPSKQLIN